MYVVESITKKSIVEITFRTNIGNGQSVKLKVNRNGMDKVNGGRREKEDRDRSGIMQTYSLCCCCCFE